MVTTSHLELLKAGEPLLSTGNVIWTDNKDHLAYTALFLPLDGASAPLQHLLVGLELWHLTPPGQKKGPSPTP